MMKKTWSALVMAALMTAVLCAGALAAEHVDHKICGESGACSHAGAAHGSSVIWTAWDGSVSNFGLGSSSGTVYVYLEDDVTVTSPIELSSGQNVYLCLNGHNLIVAPSTTEETNALRVSSGAYFLMTDCQSAQGSLLHASSDTGFSRMCNGRGVITRGTFDLYGGSIREHYSPQLAAAGVYVTSGVMNMYGGEIAENYTETTYAGGVYVGSSATLNLYGGTIANNECDTDGSSSDPLGGGVFVQYGGVLNMYGGSISGNKDSGVYLKPDTGDYVARFNMTGGTIKGNGNNTGNGGGVRLDGGVFTMSGGSITGNKTYSPGVGGGVYAGAGSKVNLSDDAEIDGNSGSNLYLESGLIASRTGALTGSIGITTQEAPAIGLPVFVMSGMTESDLEHLHADKNYRIGLNSSAQAYVGVLNHAVAVTGGTVKAGAGVVDGMAEEGASVTVTAYAPEKGMLFDRWTAEGLTLTEEQAVAQTLTFVMPQNAVTLTAVYKEDPSAHRHCVCGDADCTDETHEKVVYEEWDGTSSKYLYSGTYNIVLTGDATENLSAPSGMSLNLCLNGHTYAADYSSTVSVESGTLNICDCAGGGVMSNGSGNRAVYAKTSTVNLYGIDFAGSTGGALSMAGSTLNMYGGEIRNNESYGDGTGLYASGSASAVLLDGVTIAGNDNSAGEHGYCAAIRCDGGTLELVDCVVSGNTTYDRGAIGLYGTSRTTMRNTDITGNSGSLTGDYLTYNFAGGVYLSDSAQLTMEGGTVKNNKAANGGGIAITSANAKATLKGVHISGNSATLLGGGVYLQSGTLEVGGSTYVTMNTAAGVKSNVMLNNGRTIANAGGFSGSVSVTTQTKPGAHAPVDIMTGVTNSDLGRIFSDEGYLRQIDGTTAQLYVETPAYNLTVSGGRIAEGAATGNGESSGTAEPGASVTIESMVPADGYQMVWAFTGLNTTGMDLAQEMLTFTMPENDVTAMAMEMPIEYAITYQLDGGALAEGQQNPAVYTVETPAFTLINPQRKGYIFTGWTSSEDPTLRETVTITPEAGTLVPLTFTAHWVKATYQISVSGGKVEDMMYGPVTSRPAEEGETIWISADQFMEEGYNDNRFVRWEITGLDGVLTEEQLKSSSLSFAMPANSVHAAAVFAYPYVALNCIETSGREDAYAQQGETLTFVPDPPEGEAFAAWRIENMTESELSAIDLTQETLTFVMPKKPVTVYPETTLVSYTVAYDFAGGAVNGAYKTTYDKSMVFHLPYPKREGYTFAGWTGTGLTEAKIDVVVQEGTTGDLSYTATWTPVPYAIWYDYAGGGMAPGAENPESYTVETETFALLSPVREGYTFTGWTAADGGAPRIDAQVEKGTMGELWFTANWTPVSYDIAYDLAGGAFREGMTAPESYHIESDLFSLPEPVREGYLFAGWTGTDVADPTISVRVFPGSMGDRSYTAVWTPIEYRIRYHLEGGELPDGEENPHRYTVETETFTLVNPVCEGYVFRGWTGGGLDRARKTVTIEKGSMGERTYYAVWQQIPETETELRLPASLREIRDEAFTGAPAERVVIGKKCVRIGSRAFADCRNLKVIVIPESVKDIAEDAFKNIGQLIIVAPEGSAAEVFADEHDFACTPAL